MSGAIATLRSSDPGNPATLPDAEFLAWLRDRFADAVRDEAFRLRLEIRGLWLANPELLAARDRLDAAERAFRSSPESADLDRMAKALQGAEAAVEGITLAVLEGRSDDERKLAHYEQQVAALHEELERRRAASEPHQQARRARSTMDDLLAQTGLADKRAELREVEQARGRGTGEAGRRFEDRGAETIEATWFPALRARGHDPRLLRGVTLGCARGEWDGLVVEASATAPAIVLGMVEFKRNPNDIAHGFALRQENLAWLRGDEGRYDPAAYRTQRYPTGRFEGPVVEAGLTFSARSFAELEPDPASGDVLSGLRFVTTDRELTGLSSRSLHRLLNRLAGDLSVDWSDPDTVVKTVRSWLDPDELRTAEVLRRYEAAGLHDNVAFPTA